MSGFKILDHQVERRLGCWLALDDDEMGTAAQLENRSVFGNFDFTHTELDVERRRFSDVSRAEDDMANPYPGPIVAVHDLTVALDAPRWPELVWPSRLGIGGVEELGLGQTNGS